MQPVFRTNVLFFVLKQTNYLQIEKKVNSNKQYEFGIAFSGNPKKTHTDKVNYKVLYSV